LFQGDLIKQLKLWLIMGIYAIPLGTALFGLLLRFLTKRFLNINLSIARTIWVQFVAILISWVFTLILLVSSLLIHNHTLFQSINGVTAVFIAGGVYARMLKDPELRPIGMTRGLRLSAVMMLIAILLHIPLKLLRT
jgi:hypothetical protein